MPENHNISDKQPGGWTLIVLLIVVAIIALLMAVYLPSVLQVYTPPTSPGQEGTRKSTLDHVRDQLAPIDQRNKELEDVLNQQSGQDQEQTDKEKQDQQDQEDQKDDHDQ